MNPLLFISALILGPLIGILVGVAVGLWWARRADARDAAREVSRNDRGYGN